MDAMKEMHSPTDAELSMAEVDALVTKPIGRRVMLSMMGLGGLGILWGSKVQRAMERALRPVTTRDSTGLTSLLPSAGRFRIYTVTNDLPAKADADYRLTIDGLVDKPTTFTIDDIRNQLPQTKMTKDFQCVTGWRVAQVPWKGVLLNDVLDHVGVKSSATHLLFTSFDGAYTESLTIAQARRKDVLVAHMMEGKNVSQEHGGPVRMYVAPMYGYKSCKWLAGITLTNGLQDPGFWEVRGYDTDAWIGGSNGRVDEPA